MLLFKVIFGYFASFKLVNVLEFHCNWYNKILILCNQLEMLAILIARKQAMSLLTLLKKSHNSGVGGLSWIRAGPSVSMISSKAFGGNEFVCCSKITLMSPFHNSAEYYHKLLSNRYQSSINQSKLTKY